MKFGHKEHAVVRTHEVDKDKRMHVPSMLMLMQEASMQNVLHLKASVWDMEDDQISWVLLRKELTVHKRPLLGETIVIETYPAGFDRVLAYRDFWIRNEEGDVLASAGSTWTLIHMQTRKMVRIPQKFYSFHTDGGGGYLQRPGNKIPMLRAPEFSKEYEIAYFDLDWNGHVNNNVLSKLVLQSMPPQYHTTRQLQKMTIHIKSETFLGDRLVIACQEEGRAQTLHSITTADNTRLVLQAVCEWL